MSVNCEKGDKFQVVKDNRPKRETLSHPYIPEYDQTEELQNPDSELNHFIQFKRNFGRTYENKAEEARRYRIFQNNLFLIRQLNKYEEGSAIYGVTDFTDLTQAEYMVSVFFICINGL